MGVETIEPEGLAHTPAFNDKGQLVFSVGDKDDPKNWSNAWKMYITIVAMLLVLNATFASSAPTGVFEGIEKDLHVSLEAAGLVITLFLLGYCAGPLIWAPLSEFYGRRWISLLTCTLYLAFNFLCAFAPNFGALLAGRFLTGTFASSSLTNSAGILADIWNPVARGNAMIFYTVCTFAGPAFSPMIAGFLQVTKTWQWSFYVLILLAALPELMLFATPETLASIVLRNKAKKLRKSNPKYEGVLAPVEASDRTLKAVFKVALTRPWRILVDPISFLVAVYFSFVYTLIYMMFSIYPIIFQLKRGWNPGVGALPLLGVVVGAFLGSSIYYFITVHEKKKAATGYVPTPEDRLPAAMIGAVLFAVSMFWFSWSGEYNSVHWIVPTIAGTFLAVAIFFIFVSFFNYIVDTYTMYAASALAANTVARSACGAAAPLFTNQMFKALGVGGGGSLIAGVSVLLAPIPFIFYKYGKQIREKSNFAKSG